MIKKYKLFKFTEVFDYERGKRFTKQEHVCGDIAYISSTKSNNGIDDFVNPPEKNLKGSKIKIYNNCLTLSNSGSVGILFYHDYSFVASDHVTVIWIKNKNIKLNKYIALYLKPIFESIKYKYNFGREISNPNLENEYLKLPITKESKPDWEYMENYIKKLEKTISFTQIKTNNNKKTSYNISYWKWFSLSDLFYLHKGKEENAKCDDNGEVNLISATQFNNGVNGKKNAILKFKGNLITVSSNGEVGEAFYQDSPFCATGDVNILEPKTKYMINKYSALFIITMIRQEKFRYTYGRKWGITRMEKSQIKLPAIKKNGIYEPDFQYMENYIKTLPYADLI